MSIATFSALPAASVVLDQVLTPQVTEQTIVRVRGVLALRSDQIGALEDFHGAFGMAVVEEPAAGVGVTAVPSPVFNAASEAWFVWQAFAGSFTFVSAVGFDGNAGHQYEIDSRAMRKVNSEQRVVILLENNAATHGLDYWFHLRILSMLKS